MAQDATGQQQPTPVYQYYVVLSHDRRIIHRHSVRDHGPYNPQMYQDMLNEYPGSTIEAHVDSPAHFNGHVLSADGRTATRPVIDMPFDTVTSRRELVESWALDQLQSLLYFGNVGISLDYLYADNVFHGFVFNTILISSNPENLRDADKWDSIQNGLIPVGDMFKRLARTEFSRLNSIDHQFYDVGNVYLWYQDGLRLVKSRTLVSNDPKPADNNIPDYGVGRALYTTRETMRIPHPSGVREHRLSGLVVNDQAGNALELTPTFSQNTTSYTINAAASVTSVTVTPTLAWEYATVKVDGDLDLPKAVNDISIHVTSEDKERNSTYIVKINKPTP